MFIRPLFWAVILLIWALITKKANRKKWLIGISAFLLFLFSNKVVVNELYLLTEPDSATYNATSKCRTAVVLGGFADFDEARNTLRLTDAADRLFKAIDLFQKKQIDTLVISGGAAIILGNKIPESVYVKNYLIGLGLDSTRIIIETKSKNTYENAIFTMRQMKELGLQPNIILITSASHMMRAEGVFLKAGFTLNTLPVNYISRKQRGYILSDYLLPSSEALFRFDAIIKEWFGVLVYKFTGKM